MKQACFKEHVLRRIKKKLRQEPVYVQIGMCVQQRFNSVCTFTQADKRLSYTPDKKNPLDPWLPIERQLKTQISQRRSTGGSESSIGAYASLYL